MWLCTSKTLVWTLKLEFHLIFTCRNSSLFGSLPVKNVQTILSSQGCRKNQWWAGFVTPLQRVIHSATQRTHITYAGLHLLWTWASLLLPSRPPALLTCLHPGQTPALPAEGDTEAASQQAHICHLGSLHFVTFLCGINTYLQNCSS